MSFYDHDDDDYVQRLDVDGFINDVDWLERTVGEVIPDTEKLSIEYAIIDKYDAEVWISGGRFERPEYDTDAWSLLQTIKEFYPECDWTE